MFLQLCIPNVVPKRLKKRRRMRWTDCENAHVIAENKISVFTELCKRLYRPCLILCNGGATDSANNSMNIIERLRQANTAILHLKNHLTQLLRLHFMRLCNNEPISDDPSSGGWKGIVMPKHLIFQRNRIGWPCKQ